MRVEIRGPEASDVRGHTDPALRAGEVQRDGADLRVGFSPESGADGLRSHTS
jgi:hypothetical protein